MAQKCSTKDFAKQPTLISVIVPVYNVEPYLAECVESILRQTYRDFELILVDDGSTDASGRMCDDFARRDPRIRVIHKPNGGLSSARNAGLDVARGEYVSFVDSDDWIAIDAISVLLCGIKSSSSDICIAGIRSVDANGKTLYESPKGRDGLVSPSFAYRHMGEMEYVVAVNKLYKREIFRDIRFPNGKHHEDVFVEHKILSACAKIYRKHCVVYYYRQHPGSFMHSAFSIRNLDMVEALTARALFFSGVGKVRLANKWFSIAARHQYIYRKKAAGHYAQRFAGLDRFLDSVYHSLSKPNITVVIARKWPWITFFLWRTGNALAARIPRLKKRLA